MSGQPAVHPTAQVKTERLLNLVICLLYTRRPLPKARIRAAVPQYHGTATDEAFDRMFERDKDELRELGIPLVTAEIDARLRRRGRLPDRPARVRPAGHLVRAGRAGGPGPGRRTWAQASLAGPAAQALRKLKAAGVEQDDDSLVGIEPGVRHHRAGLRAAPEGGASTGARSTFGYRKPRRRASQTRHRPAVGAGPVARPLVPHRLRPRPRAPPGVPAVADRRRRHRQRSDRRLRRARGPRRPGDDRLHPGPDVAAAGRHAAGARRQRQRAAPPRHAPRPTSGASGVELEVVPFRDVDRLADEVAATAPDVVGGRAAELSEAVVRRLQRRRGVRRAAPEEEP